jgi:indoleamine 2,3-dioxygenase
LIVTQPVDTSDENVDNFKKPFFESEGKMGPLSLRERGFLPDRQADPLVEMPGEYQQIDLLGLDTRTLFGTSFLRAHLDAFPLVDVSQLRGSALIRAGVIYLFAQSAYVHNRGQKTSDHIPASIALPTVAITQKLKMPPILSYYFYCLNNWHFLKWHFPQREDDFSPDNLCTNQNFIDHDAENWFIVIHVAIEKLAGRALAALLEAQQDALREQVEKVAEKLTEVAGSLGRMIDVLKRMPERCSADDYFRIIRPQIFGFSDVVYEGVEQFAGKKQSFRGETGAQSTVIPAIKKFLGVQHKESLLTNHLRDMINYMPPLHRAFLQETPIMTEQGSLLRDLAITHRENLPLKNAYNDCVTLIYKFEDIHFHYADDYINKKVTNPAGTGGTPFMEWLYLMKEETIAFLIA